MKNQMKKCLILMALLLPACAFAAEPNEVKGYQDYRNKMIADQTRPIYHLLSPLPGNHNADPNFAMFWKGKYHLFFIVPGGVAHVSSVDMVHWRWHPTAPMGGLSGTMFVNRDGTPTIITMHQKAELFFAKDDDLVNWSGPVVIEPKVQPGPGWQQDQQLGSRCLGDWEHDLRVAGGLSLEDWNRGFVNEIHGYEKLGLRWAVYEQGDSRCSAKHQ